MNFDKLDDFFKHNKFRITKLQKSNNEYIEIYSNEVPAPILEISPVNNTKHWTFEGQEIDSALFMPYDYPQFTMHSVKSIDFEDTIVTIINKNKYNDKYVIEKI